MKVILHLTKTEADAMLKTKYSKYIKRYNRTHKTKYLLVENEYAMEELNKYRTKSIVQTCE